MAWCGMHFTMCSRTSATLVMCDVNKTSASMFSLKISSSTKYTQVANCIIGRILPVNMGFGGL